MIPNFLCWIPQTCMPCLQLFSSLFSPNLSLNFWLQLSLNLSCQTVLLPSFFLKISPDINYFHLIQKTTPQISDPMCLHIVHPILFNLSKRDTRPLTIFLCKHFTHPAYPHFLLDLTSPLICPDLASFGPSWFHLTSTNPTDPCLPQLTLTGPKKHPFDLSSIFYKHIRTVAPKNKSVWRFLK